MSGLTTSALLIVALSGCATPKGVADTASLVAKLSAQMSGQIEEYTAKQNEVRGMDERRLGTMHAATETLVADNRTQFDLIRVTADKDTMRLLESVKSGRIGDAAVAPPAAAATPSTAPVPAAKPVAVRNRFDIAPLTNLAAVATGRNSIGNEIEPTYLKIAEQRVRLATAMPRTFGASHSTLRVER